jgi:hypothetical protein
MTGGATLKVALTAGGTQCFAMPAGGWSPAKTIGFKYLDPAGANGPVKTALVKRTKNGTFQVKAIILGKNGPIAVTPGDPTTDYAMNFMIGDGDEYCGTGGGLDATKNDEKTFKDENDAGVGCTVTACSPGGALLDRAPLF